eukprot:CAMPEP_0179049422 /NCGR_PEP_ID=MMETSP0796-20121207/20204_1 /TAXON_ID=73915 /ORGANISM="Pyrodinium bahamense, Strain pbaha01" /LENGTH=258 /DNA_ID=CAMNT_0020745897 /DNA_START=84 /DNA_END=860 /DNA_ORIENTATION=+
MVPEVGEAQSSDTLRILLDDRRRQSKAWCSACAIALVACAVFGTQLRTGRSRQSEAMRQDVLLRDEKSVIRFPLTFEGVKGGACPPHFSCSKKTSGVCYYPPLTIACTHPWLKGLQGSRYFRIANDKETGVVTSDVFYLPSGIDRLEYLTAGGSDVGSGLYVHLVSDSSVICKSEYGEDSNVFTLQRCAGLTLYAGQMVFMCLADLQRGVWAKLMVDDIRLKDQFGNDIGEAVLAGIAPGKLPDCRKLHRERDEGAEG